MIAGTNPKNQPRGQESTDIAENARAEPIFDDCLFVQYNIKEKKIAHEEIQITIVGDGV